MSFDYNASSMAIQKNDCIIIDRETTNIYVHTVLTDVQSSPPLVPKLSCPEQNQPWDFTAWITTLTDQ